MEDHSHGQHPHDQCGYRKVLEERIASYESAIIRTKREINDLVPIVDLIPEILIAIFKHCRPPLHRTVDGSRPGRWIKSVSHVCHRWREVSIHAPDLWNEINVCRPDLVRLFFCRSKDALLDIADCACSNAEITNMLLRDFSRIRSVALNGANLEKMMYNRNSGKHAPHLRELRISYHNNFLGSITSTIWDGRTDCSLKHIVNLECPRLEHLQIRGYTTSWDHRLFSGSLKTLSLQMDFLRGTARVAQTLRALAQMPLLETLELADIHAKRHNEPATPRTPEEPIPQTVHLPLLKKLTLSDSVPNIALFIDHIVWIRKTSVTITARPSDDSESLRLVQILASKLATLEQQDGHQLGVFSIRSELGLVYTIKAWAFPSDGQSRVHPHVVDCPSLQLDLGTVTAAAINKICESLPLRHVSRALVSGHICAGQTNAGAYWKSTFSKMRGVHVLDLADGAEIGFGKALAARFVPAGPTDVSSGSLDEASKQKKQCEGPASFILFPYLKQLTMRHFRWVTHPEYPDASHDVRDSMLEALRYRKEAGAMLASMYLHSCVNLDEDAVHELGPLVKKVDWDQCVQWDYDESEEEDEDPENYIEEDSEDDSDYLVDW